MFYMYLIAFVIRFEELVILKDFNFYSAFISINCQLIFLLFGLYRTVFRFAGMSIIFSVFSAALYGLVYFLVIEFMELKEFQINWVLQPMLLFCNYVLTIRS